MDKEWIDVLKKEQMHREVQTIYYWLFNKKGGSLTKHDIAQNDSAHYLYFSNQVGRLQ